MLNVSLHNRIAIGYLKFFNADYYTTINIESVFNAIFNSIVAMRYSFNLQFKLMSTGIKNPF